MWLACSVERIQQQKCWHKPTPEREEQGAYNIGSICLPSVFVLYLSFWMSQSILISGHYM